MRVLGGFLRLVGLVQKPQRNLAGYALTAYKRAAEKNDFEIAWRFERVVSTRRVPIKFVGVWDTVSSVIVPRPDRFYVPSLQELPYTKSNSFVEVFRHALAIDERRRMFRANVWREPQFFKPNPFSKDDGAPQDTKQVWFAGVHSDVGGGYPEAESALAKYPLRWMIDEAIEHGLAINKALYNHLVLGEEREGSSRSYVAPDPTGRLHDSMNAGWRVLEWLPKRARRIEWRVFAFEVRLHDYIPDLLQRFARWHMEFPKLENTADLIVVSQGKIPDSSAAGQAIQQFWNAFKSCSMPSGIDHGVVVILHHVEVPNEVHHLVSDDVLELLLDILVYIGDEVDDLLHVGIARNESMPIAIVALDVC